MNLCILKKFFRPLGLGLGLAPLESEATYTRPRPLKFGLEAEARPRVLTSLAKRIYNSTSHPKVANTTKETQCELMYRVGQKTDCF